MDWAADFSYEYLQRLLRVAQARFAVHVLADAPRLPQSPARPRLFLRNDVDVSLPRALRFAELEQAAGVCATIMVMINSPLYRIEDPGSRAILADLVAMGHEVGLHFDFDDPASRLRDVSLEAAEPAIAAACARLEAVTGTAVLSVSFHRPLLQFLRGPLHVAGRVNAYARALMTWYLSDSGGRWREGEPLALLAGTSSPVLQLLMHPIWWAPTHQAPADRLRAFLDAHTAGWSGADRAEYVAMLGAHIQVWPRGAAASAPGAATVSELRRGARSWPVIQPDDAGGPTGCAIFTGRRMVRNRRMTRNTARSGDGTTVARGENVVERITRPGEKAG